VGACVLTPGAETPPPPQLVNRKAAQAAAPARKNAFMEKGMVNGQAVDSSVVHRAKWRELSRALERLEQCLRQVDC
jgi:hypothetical protein